MTLGRKYVNYVYKSSIVQLTHMPIDKLNKMQFFVVLFNAGNAIISFLAQ